MQMEHSYIKKEEKEESRERKRQPVRMLPHSQKRPVVLWGRPLC